jgi:two-component system CheB/CheR fusion protein
MKRQRRPVSFRSRVPVSTPRPRVSASPRPSIVGIGASAGGLEALEAFFKQVPKETDLAFVVVQHLDPTHKGAMVELLQRVTELPVLEVKDRTRVQAGRVYVIPPNRDLSILHGVLHLIEPAAPRGLRLPIDFFLRSLADDRQERSIGVILSGMGSDGTLGLRAIKEHAGASFVQAPESAKFDGMPRSAIEAGLADVVAPVEELPGKIADYLKSAATQVRPGRVLADREQSALEKVIILLRAGTGHDFSLYKRSNLYRRIERRMSLHQLPKIADYVRYLSSNAQEADLLFKELLIGVTSFFRDPAVWEQVKAEAIPPLLAAQPKGALLRAWVAGCATGEEAYSLAIVFKEALDKLKPGRDVQLQVFATDLDNDAIEQARAAFYPASITADVSPERLRRFFSREERGYRVNKQIREMVVFARHNLIMDPPFTKLDFLSCRNLLIYLEPELQRRLLALFHYSLNPGGVLLLGTAESTGVAGALFTPFAGKSRLYRRALLPATAEPPEMPPVFGRPRTDVVEPVKPAGEPAQSLTALADRLLHQQYTPAAVLVTSTGDIVYVGGKTGKYLEPAAGKANWNVFAMARPGLDSVIYDEVRKAIARETAVTVRGVQVKTDAGVQPVDVTIQPLSEPPGLRGTVLVVFTDSAQASVRSPRRSTSRRSARQLELENELRRAQEEVHATREEMQTSQEELKTANEELQSTNEELQSTNEELTTSKEEMQSMNEELSTLNQELQVKLDELSRASDDMKNLLNSTNIATLFLDDEMNVRRFTTEATKLFKLLPGDVGRPITDLATDLEYPGLVENLREVLGTLVYQERTVPTRDGRWYAVRIMPYRTQDDRIDGLVITFSDVTTAKRLEGELRARGAGVAGMKEPRGRGGTESDMTELSDNSDRVPIQPKARTGGTERP